MYISFMSIPISRVSTTLTDPSPASQQITTSNPQTTPIQAPNTATNLGTSPRYPSSTPHLQKLSLASTILFLACWCSLHIRTCSSCRLQVMKQVFLLEGWVSDRQAWGGPRCGDWIFVVRVQVWVCEVDWWNLRMEPVGVRIETRRFCQSALKQKLLILLGATLSPLILFIKFLGIISSQVFSPFFAILINCNFPGKESRHTTPFRKLVLLIENLGQCQSGAQPLGSIIVLQVQVYLSLLRSITLMVLSDRLQIIQFVSGWMERWVIAVRTLGRKSLLKSLICHKTTTLYSPAEYRYCPLEHRDKTGPVCHYRTELNLLPLSPFPLPSLTKLQSNVILPLASPTTKFSPTQATEEIPHVCSQSFKTD